MNKMKTGEDYARKGGALSSKEPEING